MYAILITNKWTGSKSLYPVVYKTKEEATKPLYRSPYSKVNNTLEIVELCQKK